MAINIVGANSEQQRLTFTIRRWLQDNTEDQFAVHHALFRKLKEKKRILNGGFGDRLVLPTRYPAAAGPQPIGVIDPYAAASHAPMTGLTSLKYDIVEYMMPISVPKRELRAQGSLTRKVN